MTLRIDAKDLPRAARESLARGEPVEVIGEGQPVAMIQPPAGARGGLRKFFRARLETGPLGEEWGESLEDLAAEIEDYRRWANYTGGLDPWDDFDRSEEWNARQDRIRSLVAQRKARSSRLTG